MATHTCTLAVYLAFPRHTREAFEHYRQVLGGELFITTYGEQQLEGLPFSPDPDAVAHAVLTTPGGTLTGGDADPEGTAEEGGTLAVRDTVYSLLWTCDTVEEGQRVIDGFVAGGGEVGMPFLEAPWGDHYGQVFDRFGVMWAVSVPAQR